MLGNHQSILNNVILVILVKLFEKLKNVLTTNLILFTMFVMNVSRSTLLFFWYSKAYYIEQFVKSMPVKAAFEVCPAGAPSFVF